MKATANSGFGTFKDILNPCKCLSGQLEETKTILSSTRTNLEISQQLAKSIVELLSTTKHSMSSLNNQIILDPLEVLEQLSVMIKELTERQQKSDECIRLLVENAGPFRRFLFQIDKFIVLIKGKLGSVQMDSIDALFMRFKNYNMTLSERKDLEVTLEDLKKLVKLNGHNHQKLIEVMNCTRISLENAETHKLQGELNTTINLFESIENAFIQSTTSFKECSGSVEFLIDHIEFIGSILLALPDVKANKESNFLEFEELLNEFYEEARQDNFPDEIQAYSDLLTIKSKLERIRIATHLAKKHIVVVAGGFSCGKTSFINSLIGNLLPTDITPTTSIPTYVYHLPNESLGISSFNNKGGKLVIDQQLLHTISHQYERFFGIPLNKIIDRIVVNTPGLENWDRISFVDTPGYTASELHEVNRSESDTTLDEILSSNYLVWLLDCEKGTITDTDIDYIKKFVAREKRSECSNDGEIYIIVNKCDKKPSSQHKQILEHLAELAKNHGIPYAGIGMYSAHTGIWKDFVGKPFNEFIDDINNLEPELSIKVELSQIIEQYIDYHQLGAQKCKSRIADIKQILLLVDKGLEPEDSSNEIFNEYCEELNLELEKHMAHEKTYKSLLRRFHICTSKIINEI